jgi:hypothetical protein
MSAVVPSLNCPVTAICVVWPTEASVTFAPLIVADTRMGAAAEVGEVGGGVEPPHEMYVNDNAVAAARTRALQRMDEF